MNIVNDTIWVEKYRPTEIDDCILPPATMNTAKGFIAANTIPNLLLTGSAGTGKTTLAKILCYQLNYEWIMINGSNEGRSLDTLRNTVALFASSMSFDGRRKCVIIDEADHIPDLTQAAMRNFIEEYHANCSFILTCNYPNKIIEPLHSRCSRIDFAIPTNKKEQLVLQMFKRVTQILNEEKIEFDQKSVLAVCAKHFPDFRRTLNELQRYASTGKIDSGILVNTEETELAKLISILKDKNFTDMRNWVATTPNVEMADISRKLYDRMGDLVKPASRPQLVLHLADYQYKNHFVMDPQINLAALFTSIMIDVEFI